MRRSPAPFVRALLALAAVACGGGSETTQYVTGGTSPGGAVGAVSLTNPGLQVVSEETAIAVPIAAQGTVRAEVLPPGAIWDSASRVVYFRPDFIQGGHDYPVTLTATNGQQEVTETFSIRVQDTIRPPAPTVQSTTDASDHQLLVVRQTTDSFLDSPGYAGRTFNARVVVNKGATAQARRPVRVYLHGFGGSPYTGGRSGEFAIYPHDPSNTYWWGYSDQLPNGTPTTGTVPNYTQRRILNLVEWLLDTYPGADPENVYVAGGSMGGAGAATLGLLYARHFSYVYATIGQKIPRNHRSARAAQLEGHWGSRTLNLDDGQGMGVWDRMDMTRVLLETYEARDQFIFTKHGKDDGTIHFGAMVFPSPLTGVSFFQALQLARAGHYCVWDEGGHGSDDPVLGGGWWDGGWNSVFDQTTFLRRDLAFPAFAHSSLDDDPGQGSNGRRSYNETSGYAGSVGTAGDTGWDGAIAGAVNRHLRWDARAIVDTPARFEVPLRVQNGSGSAPPRAGYPTVGDQVQGAVPATVDVTIRRAQRFRTLPNETVRYTFGALSGTIAADANGALTLPALPIPEAWTTLVLER